MRLFLSSQNLGNYPDVFLKLMGDNKKLAFTENAKDSWSLEDRAAKVQEHKEQFTVQGFDFFELDLRKFFGKEKELESFLKTCGGIWVSGGNTFFLRKAFAYSGLDNVLEKLVRNNKLAYGGSSAGSIIATPSLKGSEFGDEPDVVPKGYKKDLIWDGLNFVPFYIVPHYKSDWFGAEAEAMAQYFEENKMPYRSLRDGQVILISDDIEVFLK